MRTGGSFLARALAAVAALLVLAVPLVAQTPSDEQLQLLQGLSPEQLEVVLERMAVDGEAGRSLDSAADGATGQERRNARLNRTADRSQSPLDADMFEDPVLVARDWVTVEVALRADDLAEEEADAKAKDQAGNAQPDKDKDKRDEADEEDNEGKEEEDARLGGIAALVLSRNPYALDRSAQLNLPGFAPIALGGLTEEQATKRLALEPALAGLHVRLTLLPLDDGRLKPFGHEFFKKPSAAFSSGTDLPVPADYVVGPGDRFNVQLFGNQNRNLRLTVNRDGSINFPELGPIQVGGMTFSAASRTIESRVQSELIGVRADVSLGDARTISVFVVGEARRPGSYPVSGLATMTTALFASGGVTSIGSLRDIQLKRQGQVVRHFDLYDLLIGGDTSGDAKLLPGDVILIPPVGPTVSADGEVKRPAIYELRAENNVADLVRIAGGLTPAADGGRASLTRIDATSRRVVQDVNLSDAAGRGQLLGNGDVLHVAALRPQLDAGVTLDGFVYRPGLFAWREGMRLTDVIGSVEELKPGADHHYILIRRAGGPEQRVSVVSADLTAALAARGSAADPQLATRDRIFVFELAPGRERIIRPLLDDLRVQSDINRPTEIVSVRGSVKVSGQYPLEPGMRVADLLRAGGGLMPAAFGDTAELTRFSINASGARELRQLSVDLAAVRRGDVTANLELRPDDNLLVQEAPDWNGQQTVVLRGEVRFPGTYLVRKGETLHELLARAGGLTSLAFPEGSAFTRSDLKKLEQQQIDRLAESLRGDLATLSIQAARAGQASASETLLTGQALLTQLQGAKATGRFIIDLPGLLAAGAHSAKDVLLRDGDQLLIPRQRQEVTVIGEIQSSSSHLYQGKLARADYIKASGGATRRADRAHIYVVRADGSAATDGSIKPGDTIVVPVDAERMPRLPFWQAVTQILYNVSLSVAAVNSF